MAEKNWPGPKSRVASTADGHAIEIDKPKIQQTRVPRSGRRRLPGEDALKDLDKFKVVKDGGSATAGVEGTPTDIREGPMPKTRRPNRHCATFTSIDGETYSFRTHDTKGKALQDRAVMAVFIALREIGLGGDARNVLDAFKFQLKDMDGKQFYPILEETLERFHVERPAEPEEEPEDAQEYKLGDVGD
jgi:hypothetical protein